MNLGVTGTRRWWIWALAVVVFVCGASAASARAATESSTFQVDPAHNGYVYGV